MNEQVQKQLKRLDCFANKLARNDEKPSRNFSAGKICELNYDISLFAEKLSDESSESFRRHLKA